MMSKLPHRRRGEPEAVGACRELPVGHHHGRAVHVQQGRRVELPEGAVEGGGRHKVDVA